MCIKWMTKQVLEMIVKKLTLLTKDICGVRWYTLSWNAQQIRIQHC